MYGLPYFDLKRSLHYEALFVARCGDVVLVYYEGAPENGKTQLDEHEETCPKCQEWREKNIVPAYVNEWWFKRHNLDPSGNYTVIDTRHR